MDCTNCKGKTKVLDTRHHVMGETQFTSRTRQCVVCGKRFSTTERPDEMGAFTQQLTELRNQLALTNEELRSHKRIVLGIKRVFQEEQERAASAKR